jgi:hypothetical protein
MLYSWFAAWRRTYEYRNTGIKEYGIGGKQESGKAGIPEYGKGV